MRPDFVAQFVALAREIPVDRLDGEIRARFGGQQVRIDRKPPPVRPTLDDIDARLRDRKPVTAISAELGVSRATIYRMLNTGRGKSRQR
jgi:DNA invertase Pin-like site-specific DNA recombinase